MATSRHHHGDVDAVALTVDPDHHRAMVSNGGSPPSRPGTSRRSTAGSSSCAPGGAWASSRSSRSVQWSQARHRDGGSYYVVETSKRLSFFLYVAFPRIIRSLGDPLGKRGATSSRSSSGQKEESRDTGILGLVLWLVWTHTPGDMPRVRFASMLYSRLKKRNKRERSGKRGLVPKNVCDARRSRATALSRVSAKVCRSEIHRVRGRRRGQARGRAVGRARRGGGLIARSRLHDEDTKLETIAGHCCARRAWATRRSTARPRRCATTSRPRVC